MIYNLTISGEDEFPLSPSLSRFLSHVSSVSFFSPMVTLALLSGDPDFRVGCKSHHYLTPDLNWNMGFVMICVCFLSPLRWIGVQSEFQCNPNGIYWDCGQRSVHFLHTRLSKPCVYDARLVHRGIVLLECICSMNFGSSEREFLMLTKTAVHYKLLATVWWRPTYGFSGQVST